MLMECPECHREISDQAPACPHCGYLAKRPEENAAPSQANASIASTASSELHVPTVANGSGFLIAAAIAFVFCLVTPRILIVLPALCCIVLAIVSLVRRERFRWGGVVIVVLTVLLVIESSEEMRTITGPVVTANAGSDDDQTANLAAAKISDWNWNADPDFGTHGAVKWNVAIFNSSSRAIASAKVDFTTYDNHGKMIATTFAYVEAIPPGQTRNENSFADYYGTEKKASVVVSEVRFAN